MNKETINLEKKYKEKTQAYTKEREREVLVGIGRCKN